MNKLELLIEKKSRSKHTTDSSAGQKHTTTFSRCKEFLSLKNILRH